MMKLKKQKLKKKAKKMMTQPAHNLYKYPRTKHIKQSKTITSDDKTMSEETFNKLSDKKYIALLKMDGECTTLYPEWYHARSISSKSGSGDRASKLKTARSYVKNLWATLKYKIPKGMRICGENLYATHTINYTYLESYFMVFSVWKDETCLSWADTLNICNRLGLTPVHEIARGHCNNAFIDRTMALLNSNAEGIVYRPIESFEYRDFGNKVFKYVSGNFEIRNTHWVNKPLKYNRLAPGSIAYTGLY